MPQPETPVRLKPGDAVKSRNPALFLVFFYLDLISFN